MLIASQVVYVVFKNKYDPLWFYIIIASNVFTFVLSYAPYTLM